MGITLSEVSQTKEVKYCMIIYMWNIKLREIESRMVVTTGCGVGENEDILVKETNFQLQD